MYSFVIGSFHSKECGMVGNYHGYFTQISRKSQIEGVGEVERFCEQLVKGEKKNPRGGSSVKLILELKRASHIKLW